MDKSLDAFLESKKKIFLRAFWVLAAIAIASFLYVVGYRLYLIEFGAVAENVMIKEQVFLHSYSDVFPESRLDYVAYTGTFEYQGKQYNIYKSYRMNQNRYDSGPVTVHFNPKNPESLVMHHPWQNKYVMALNTIHNQQYALLFILIGILVILVKIANAIRHRRKN